MNEQQQIIREEFFLTSDPGIQIFVREVKDGETQHMQKGPVLLLHGARVPGVASFDLDVPNGSLAADLASNGHVVYVMDARGYGKSSKPPEMAQPPTENPPLTRSSEVVRDIAAVVEWIRQRLGVGRVALLGWATGGHWNGYYTALYSDRVSHLILYNTLYGGTLDHPTLGHGSTNEDPKHSGRFNEAAFGAYRFNTADALLPSWDHSIPLEEKTQWRDPAVAQAYVAAALASDPTSDTRTPPSFRAPSGAMEDSFYLAIGRQLWDASLIGVPTLILRSERDFWSRPQDAELLTEHLVHAPRVHKMTLPDATHYVHLDRPGQGRDAFIKEVLSFLAEGVERFRKSSA
jgi:pimeloyl-ACP methyl ester carboxylesterase